MQWRIVGKDGIIVEVMEVVGVEGSRVLFERYLPLHDTVLKTVSCSAAVGLAPDVKFSCGQAQLYFTFDFGFDCTALGRWVRAGVRSSGIYTSSAAARR